MMDDSDRFRQARPPAGLCDTCVHVRIVPGRGAAVFYRCGLSDVDPRFRRYPVIPVMACPGYVPRNDPGR